MGKSKLKDGEFKYGAIEMTDEEHVDAQNPKVRTTMFLDASLISAYKKEASKRGMKYQQLMRETLASALSGEPTLEDRVSRLEREVLKKKTGN